MHHIPPLNPNHLPARELHLRDCQETAIINLEASFKAGRPRALIQMATGAGKTYTAITSIYRLLKYADAKRILFLVDTKNLGEQAEQEMMSYVPLDDAAEEINPAELALPKTPMPVVYNEKVPLEFFDFIFIDECHRSIYGH
ncbi:MAG: DEAD/DEAH box helicase family protein [Nitrosomonas sp.]|uniref:DEAD/DEAH box helicase family protein n=1 Tax=Nitrosomonas sp. TaxID=42353 RepID=UPI00273359C0|nr:DEAD/DEAH box helicase family protein [Nitrosomonas sp.]MDP3663597.1 DEAD/DEAH box helicase family protein [Nitrosomonas sp.]MDZ4104712.1 DEAD/DEAH box helicase family protein [Nitrosomonas sp.]